MSSFWVRRTNLATGRDSWTGPLRSERQAQREATAWRETDRWDAVVTPSSAAIRAEVRAWEKAKHQ